MRAALKRSHHALPRPQAPYARHGLTPRDARRLESALDMIGDYAAILMRVGRRLPNGMSFEGGADDTVAYMQDILRAVLGVSP